MVNQPGCALGFDRHCRPQQCPIYIRAAFFTCLYVWAIEAEALSEAERVNHRAPGTARRSSSLGRDLDRFTKMMIFYEQLRLLLLHRVAFETRQGNITADCY